MPTETLPPAEPAGGSPVDDRTGDERIMNLEVEFAAAERLTFFSDAVVAIAITLLALELPVPSGNSNAAILHSLGHHVGEYIAFLISFLVIGNHWLSHHRIFRYLVRLDRRLTRWNMIWLLMIVLTPFATKVLTSSDGASIQFGIYAGVQALAGLAFILMIGRMHRRGLVRQDTPPHLIVRTSIGLGTMVALFLVSIPVSWFTARAWICWLATPTVIAIIRQVRRARAGQPTPA